MDLFFRSVNSPIGTLELIANTNALIAVRFARERTGAPTIESTSDGRDQPILTDAARQLEGYFGGKVTRFDLPIELKGTEFQMLVWNALRRIPFGETETYSEIARSLGVARAARAVGAACGRNPVAIVVPCHRVVGVNGSLTGFGGGLEAKAELLALEARWRAVAGKSR